MSEQNKRSRRREQEDAAFNRMLLWLAGCAVMEAVTLLLRQLYTLTAQATVGIVLFLRAFFRVFRIAGPVLAVAAVAWTVLWFRKGRRGKALAAPLGCTGAALWLTAASILCADFSFGVDMGMTLLCALPAVVAALAIVFFLYQREFFYCSALCAAGILAIWVYRSAYTHHPRAIYVGFAAVWVFLAAAAVLTWKLRQGGGLLLGVRVLPADAGYAALLLTALVNGVLMALALAVGLSYALYVMFALIGWLFCLAVYYTVKLM